MEDIDRIVFSAYRDGGTCVLSYEDRNDNVIVSLLGIYGEIKDISLFVIGKEGIEYVMRGGYDGIKKEITLNRDEAITSIETSKEANKIARDSNKIAVLAIYVSFGGFIVSVLSILLSLIK